ncbi:hypothetical protein FQR65_LT12143 [Abscondita terminalis]|nr:hypothetical protein FQR65_LT12143 [Abscondita terminalis]
MLFKVVAFYVFVCGVRTNKLSDELMDDWNNIAFRYSEECIEETGANPILARGLFLNNQLVDEEHMRCYMKCLSVKLNYILPDGSFNRDKLLSDELMDDWNYLTSLYADECIEESGINPMVKTTIFKDRLLLDIEHMPCFLKCLFEKYQILSNTGDIDVDIWVTVVKHLDHDLADLCLQRNAGESEICTKIHHIVQCLAEENYVTEQHIA